MGVFVFARRKERILDFSRRCMAVVAATLVLSGAIRTTGAAAPEASQSDATGGKAQRPLRIANPYADVAWDQVEFLHSFSHQHGRDPQVFWEMGFRHLPLSNYYPSQPFYPLPDAFVEQHPDAAGAPNAEQHSTTDSGVHFNALGSLYTTGYGHSPRVKPGSAPVEVEFSGLNVFDANESPWLGVYRLDLSIAAGAAADRPASASLTIDGAVEASQKTYATIGDGIVRQRTLTAESPGAIYLKTDSDTIRVRVDYDAASTRITRFRLMQGTNRPWRDAFRAALDGQRKDTEGRLIEGLLFPDGGGITINHPRGSLESLLEMLDFDARVLGIEVWNQHTGFGGIPMAYYQRWDEVLRTGRQCFGFFVKDHALYGRGRNVLLVRTPPHSTRAEREREALRAYREGRFFGVLGAMAVDASGKVAPPYDHTAFRFTRIAVRDTEAGRPAALEVSVNGADRSQRPNTQIRFVTDAGVAHVASGEHAKFEFPRGASGAILCRYVRVEAFAYPNTHLGGRRLTHEAFRTLNVHEIARIHDRLGDISPNGVEPDGQGPIPLVDMLFSQPILIGARE